LWRVLDVGCAGDRIGYSFFRWGRRDGRYWDECQLHFYDRVRATADAAIAIGGRRDLLVMGTYDGAIVAGKLARKHFHASEQHEEDRSEAKCFRPETHA
jgi:hypothetical protein